MPTKRSLLMPSLRGHASAFYGRGNLALYCHCERSVAIAFNVLSFLVFPLSSHCEPKAWRVAIAFNVFLPLFCHCEPKAWQSPLILFPFLSLFSLPLFCPLRPWQSPSSTQSLRGHASVFYGRGNRL